MRTSVPLSRGRNAIFGFDTKTSDWASVGCIYLLCLGLLVEHDHLVADGVDGDWSCKCLKGSLYLVDLDPVDPVQVSVCHRFFLVLWFGQFRVEGGKPTQFGLDLYVSFSPNFLLLL